VAAELETALARASEECAKALIGLAVYGTNDQVHRVLTVMGLTDNGLVFRNLDDALSNGS
jgi:anti-anti-sigma regulatory factor